MKGDIPAMSVNTVMLILMDEKNTYTNDLRITSPGLQKLITKRPSGYVF